MDGALRPGDCTPCVGHGCLPHASARVTLQLVGTLGAFDLDMDEKAALGSASARDIAEVCGVPAASVVNLMGQNETMEISDDGVMQAFLLNITDLSANQLAVKLYTNDFRDKIVQSVKAALSSKGGAMLQVGGIDIQPAQFVPVVPTTTVASTSTSATTAAGAGAGLGDQAADMPSNAAEHQQQEAPSSGGSHGAFKDWWLGAGAGVGAAVIAGCLLLSHVRSRASAKAQQAASAASANENSNEEAAIEAGVVH